MVNRYVSVLDQLVSMADEDIVISCDAFRRNISPRYILLFDHFQVEVEICRRRMSLSINAFLVFITYV